MPGIDPSERPDVTNPWLKATLKPGDRVHVLSTASALVKMFADKNSLKAAEVNHIRDELGLFGLRKATVYVIVPTHMVSMHLYQEMQLRENYNDLKFLWVDASKAVEESAAGEQYKLKALPWTS